MTVYAILQPQSHDFSSLAKFGEVDLLFPLGLHVTNPKVVADAADAWFQNFNFNEDYYLPAGNPAVVAIVSMVFQRHVAARNQDEVSMLEWDKYARKYAVRDFFVI